MGAIIYLTSHINYQTLDPVERLQLCAEEKMVLEDKGNGERQIFLETNNLRTSANCKINVERCEYVINTNDSGGSLFSPSYVIISPYVNWKIVVNVSEQINTPSPGIFLRLFAKCADFHLWDLIDSQQCAASV